MRRLWAAGAEGLSLLKRRGRAASGTGGANGPLDMLGQRFWGRGDASVNNQFGLADLPARCERQLRGRKAAYQVRYAVQSIGHADRLQMGRFGFNLGQGVAQPRDNV